MTDGEGSARDPAQLDNLPGQSAIIELLRVHAGLPQRSRLARVLGISPLTAESRPWYDAAVSEIEVGDALAGLGDDWVVLHALPVGTGTTDIDHVVIGPGGVFIINTKSHPGQAVWASQRAFLVSGVRHPYIRNMEYEMGRVERLLGSASGIPVEVAGILAVVAAKSITVREKHRDVTVLSTASLVQWLLARPVVLGPAQVTAIGAAAQLATTWQPDAEPVGDKDALRERFAAVRTQVRRAWRLQVIWATVLTLVGAGGFVLVTYSILLNALGALGGR
ncbi:nuclease-related domain-containing protein [Conyzicola sp.]|uniref:nuclease-related domain-containing protein n=1 Tax=Conyzicola sp. TaxID=1969404 RepID=UPI0039898F4E